GLDLADRRFFLRYRRPARWNGCLGICFPRRRTTQRHPGVRDHARRPSVHFVARQRIHQSGMAWTGWSEPVVGCRPLGGLRHWRISLCLRCPKRNTSASCSSGPGGHTAPESRYALASFGRINMRRHLMTTTALIVLAMTGAASAGMDEAKQFLDKEIGDLSSLSRADQEKEMQWFIDAAKPFQGMDIKIVSESLTTHD